MVTHVTPLGGLWQHCWGGYLQWGHRAPHVAASKRQTNYCTVPVLAMKQECTHDCSKMCCGNSRIESKKKLCQVKQLQIDRSATGWHLHLVAGTCGVLQTAYAKLLYIRKCVREQRLQKQSKNAISRSSEHSQADEASIEVKSQTSNVVTAGFVETARYEVQSCMCSHAPY